MDKNQFTQLILEESKKRPLERDSGIFGDIKLNYGYVKDRFVDDKGLQTLYYGCSFPSKIRVDNRTLDSLTNLKRAFISLARVLFQHKILLPFALFYRWEIIRSFGEMYAVDLKQKTPPVEEFSPMTKELLIKGLAECEKIPLKGYSDEGREKRTWAVWCLKALIMAIQCDGAYYYRLQDCLRPDVDKTFEILLQREKVKRLKKNFRNIYFLARLPFIKSRINKFLKSLDYDIIKPDTADIYFSSRRELYDHGGLSYDTRMELVKQVDKHKNHYIISE